MLPLHLFRSAVVASSFQYPQSRVVGCYGWRQHGRRWPSTSFSTLRVGSLVATVAKWEYIIDRLAFSTLRVGSLVATNWRQLKPACLACLSVPSESGRWLLLARPGSGPRAAVRFQYPQSRVVGCYALLRAGCLAYQHLSVPSESGRWLLLPRWCRAVSARPDFQYPQSRVVGCYLVAWYPSFEWREAFSTLRVGSLVATPATRPARAGWAPLSVPSESGRWLLPHHNLRQKRQPAALSVPSESGRWLLQCSRSAAHQRA